MSKDVFDEYGNYKYPDYSNTRYTHDVSTTGGAIPKADYEARLRADMVAMLEDLKEQLREIPDSPIFDSDTELIADGFGKGVFQCQEIIQQKINSLKEQNNEANS